MTKFIKVTQCNNDTYWYQDKIGRIMPVLSESETAYMIDLSDSHPKNRPAVMKRDAVTVDEVFTYLVTYEFHPEGKPSVKQQAFAFTEKSLTSPSEMKSYMTTLRKEMKTEMVFITGLLEMTHLSDIPCSRTKV